MILDTLAQISMIVVIAVVLSTITGFVAGTIAALGDGKCPRQRVVQTHNPPYLMACALFEIKEQGDE